MKCFDETSCYSERTILIASSYPTVCIHSYYNFSFSAYIHPFHNKISTYTEEHFFFGGGAVHLQKEKYCLKCELKIIAHTSNYIKGNFISVLICKQMSDLL